LVSGKGRPDSRPPDSRELGYYFALAQVGVEMVAPMIVGLVIDQYAATSPWFTIAGIMLGFVGGITHIVLLTSKHDAAMRKDQRGSDRP
jgi:F0F1-type ATP synthase assembly protein I